MTTPSQLKAQLAKLEKILDRRTLRRLKRLISLTKFILTIERIWPAILLMAVAVGSVVAAAWLMLDQVVHVAVHLVFLAAMAGLFVLGFLRLFRLRRPSLVEIIARLEHDNDLPHQPLGQLLDREMFGGIDETSFRLWQAAKHHSANVVRAGLRMVIPRPITQKIDIYAFRAPLLLLLVIGFMASSGERFGRITTFLTPSFSAEAGRIVRVDGWINPPAYTRKPPLALQVETVDGKLLSTLTVPVGSELQFRVSGATFNLRTGAQLIEPAAQSTAILDAPLSFLTTIDRPLSVVLSGDERSWTYEIDVTEDQIPTVDVLAPPEVARSGSLTLRYAMKDDYGLARGWATVVPKDAQITGGDPLIDAPKISLRLPSRLAENGEAQTIKNLTEHPWAGAKVALRYHAADAIDQVGQSDDIDFTLPQRSFFQPLAKAVVEQRRALAINKQNRRQVANALDALMIAPEDFTPDTGHYLGLRTAYRRLILARDDDQLRAVLPLLWELALAIEDGSLSDAERRLRTAQERLMDALENNASDEEIAQLMQELREALQKFAEMLAQRAQENPQSLTQQEMDELRSLEQQDVDDILNRIEELSRQGAKDAARALLEQLQRSLENLQSAMRRQNGQSEMSEQMQELGDLIRRQQELQNQTQQEQRRQQQGQQQQGEQQPGQQQQGQEGQQGNGEPMSPEELAQRQQELSERLEELMEAMRQQGMQPGDQFGEAEGAMGDAVTDLEGSRPGEALSDQGRAIDALRQGAQELAQQLQENRQGTGEGQNGRQLTNRPDPLGRRGQPDGRQDDDRTRIPDQLDTERAREILDTIRRRLGDIERPADEKDYLERLIERF